MTRLDPMEPVLSEGKIASVAVILKGSGEAQTLLIKRSERAGDPWSGQIAFPGGKSQEGDPTVKDTAAREAMEEVGVDLGRSGRFLGYYLPFRTHTGAMLVVPAVFELTEEVSVEVGQEAQSYLWVPTSSFSNGRASTTYTLRKAGGEERLPAFEIGGYVVWGLTFRIASSLFG
jgi:8-oxo-dGTP pyrophosphatase MutT (NUDIX family)